MNPTCARGARPFGAWLAAVAGLAGLALWITLAAPFERSWPMLALDHGADLRALFGPFADGRPAAGAWRLDGVVPHRFSLEVLLTDGRERAAVAFTHARYARGLASEPRRWGERVVLVGPARDADFDRAILALTRAFEANWTRDVFVEGPGQRVRSNLPDAAYQGLFLLVAALLAALGVGRARRAWHDARHGSWRDLPWALGGALLLAAGALFRAWASPHAPLHAGHHGFGELDWLLAPLLTDRPETLFSVHEALLDLVFAVVGRSAGALWALNALVGAAVALAAGLAAREVTGSRVGAAFTALFVAFSPHLARVATSESVFLWVGLFLALALAGLARYARTRRPAWLVVGLASTALLTHLHGVTPVFVALPLAAMVLVEGPGRWRERAALALGALGVGLLLVPHVAFLRNLAPLMGADLIDSLPRKALAVFELTDLRHLYFASQASSAAVAGLTLLGVGTQALARPRGWLFLVLALPLLGVAFHDTACLTDLQRYQSPLAVVLPVLAGGAAAAIVRLGRSRPWRRTLGLGVVAGFAATLPAPMATHFTPDAEAEEYLFLERFAERAPQRATLAHLPFVRGRAVFSNRVPAFLFPWKGKSVRVVETGDAATPAPRPDDAPLFAYRGLSWAWATAWKEGTGTRSGDDGEAGAALARRLDAARAGFDAYLRHHGLVPLEAAPLRPPPNAPAWRDFYPLPRQGAALEMYGEER